MKLLQNIILILIVIVCVIGIVLYQYVKLVDDISYNDNEIVMGEPIKHKTHDHEHQGFSCCPCGGCHMQLKHDDCDEEEHHHERELRQYSFFQRLISTVLSFLTILAAQ